MATLLIDHAPSLTHEAAMRQIATALDFIVFIDREEVTDRVTGEPTEIRYVSEIIQVGDMSSDSPVPAAAGGLRTTQRRTGTAVGSPRLPTRAVAVGRKPVGPPRGLDMAWLEDEHGGWDSPFPIRGFVMNPYAIGAAVAAIGVVGGLFGVVVAARGKDTGSVFRTRTSRVRPAGARELTRRRLIRFGGAAAATAVVWLVTGWPVGALLVGTLVLTSRYFFGGGKIAADRIERLEGLEQWVRHLSDSMASGSMPVQTIVRSADHAPPAIHDQVARLATRLSTPRLDRNEALRRFADEIDDALGDIVVLALQRAVNTRGSERVPYVLQTLAEAVAAEVKARRAIEKERAGPRKETQAIIVVLGIFIGGLVVFTQYPQVYGSVQGQVVLLILGIIVLLGLWMMRRLSVGGQPPRILSEVQEPAP